MPIMPPISDYSQAEAWLLSMTDYERMLGTGAVQYDTHAFDLDRFRAQLTVLGDPHLRYAVIHVAGTKGKGSTCAFLESALRRCGFRTGLYTSPHLFRFTERIRINGAEISDADFCRLVGYLGRMMTDDGETGASPVRPVGDPGFRTVFEILTAAAFVHFAEQQVDIAIVETGLGGRLDSTNMFDRPAAGPLLNIITAIGLDHTAILGDSVHAIAAEKAGIIRPHGITIVAPQPPGTSRAVTDVIRRRCDDIGAAEPIMAINPSQMSGVAESLSGYRFQSTPTETPATTDLSDALADGMTLCPSLEGAHQASNVATALTALMHLETELAKPEFATSPGGYEWPQLNPDTIKAGIEHTAWPGRFQLIDGLVPVVIDGAHCAMSANALGRACHRRFGSRPAVIVTGFLRDKAGTELLGGIFHQLPVSRAVAVVPPSPRAVSADHIEKALSQFLTPEQITIAQSVEEALQEARSAAQESGGYVILFGSLYLVGPALNALEESGKV